MKKAWHSLRGCLHLLGQALVGKERDYTEGSLRQAVFFLAIPMVLEMALESVFAVVDVYFVAKLGPEAVAVVGLTESVNTLVYALGIGLSMATTALVSRRVGEKNLAGARRAAAQAIWLALLASLPLGLAGILAPEAILKAMGAQTEVVQAGASYTRFLLGGNLVVILLFTINAIFRGAGDASLAMRSLWFANALNIVLDPCLIFGWGPFPQLGVAGAAVATTFGRGAGVALQLFLLLASSSRIRLACSDWRPDFPLMGRLFQLSLGGIGQFLVATSSWIVLMRLMARFGSEALAGYTVGIRVLMFAILPAWGFSNAAATLVGQNLGAGKPERAEAAVWLTARTNTAFLLMVGALSILFPSTILAPFELGQPVRLMATECLRFVSIGYPFFGLGMVLVQAFNGAGDTLRPTLLNLFCFWLVEIPLAYLLAVPLGLGPRGIFLAIAGAESLMTALAWLVFSRGSWKGTRL